jgi:hypothetical protein
LNLTEGLPMIAMTLGIFALPEVFDLSATGKSVSSKSVAVISSREVLAGARDGLRRWKITIRHSLFGVFLGMVPGIGGAVIDWLSYAMGVALSKDKKEFGKGSLDGVIFAESAQNSKEGGQAIPTLAFGVPGGLSWVFILYAMLAYNIAPGPEMLGRHADITIMIAVSFGIANLLMVIIGLGLTTRLAKLTTIPYVAIGSVIVPLSFLSAFQTGDGWFGVIVLLVFTPIGLLMKAFKWPRAPLILGFILGGVIEQNLQSAISAYGTISFLTRPITLTLIAATIATTVLFLRMNRPSSLQTTGGTGSAPENVVESPANRMRRISFDFYGAWRTEHWFSLGILVFAVSVFIASFAYEPKARFLPVATSGVVIVLTLFQLVFGRGNRTGDIMDIGLRSMNTPGAGQNAVLIFIGIVLYMMVSLTVGLMYASILFAACAPLVMMTSRARIITSIVGVIVVGLMSVGLLDYYMGVYWPEPYIATWIREIW